MGYCCVQPTVDLTAVAVFVRAYAHVRACTCVCVPVYVLFDVMSYGRAQGLVFRCISKIATRVCVLRWVSAAHWASGYVSISALVCKLARQTTAIIQ